MAKITEHDRGFAFGIAVAIQLIGVVHGQDSIATELIGVTGWSAADFKRAGLEEYDLKPIRKFMPKPRRLATPARPDREVAP